MKVGLLGGSFNPPHYGHLHISGLALKRLRLNQIWWMPTRRNPFKSASIYESYEKRVAKCEVLTATHPKIYVKKFDEIYTVKLVSKLQSRYKNIEFFWIMGADNLEKFHQWESFEKILRAMPMVIFSRGKFLKNLRKFKIWKNLSRSNHQILRSKNCDISSTEIRYKRAAPEAPNHTC